MPVLELLYQIDPRAYEAALSEARAQRDAAARRGDELAGRRLRRACGAARAAEDIRRER